MHAILNRLEFSSNKKGNLMAKIYRFSLSNGEINSSNVEKKLNENKIIIRSAIDVMSPKKSISILVDDDKQDDATIQKQLCDIIETADVRCEIINEPIETLPYFVDEGNEEAIVEKNANATHNNNKKLLKHRHKHKHQHKHEHNHQHKHGLNHQHKHGHHHGWKAAIGISWGATLFFLALFEVNIPAIGYYFMTTISGIMTLMLGKDIYTSAAKKLVQEKQLSMNVLYTISTLTILGISIASFFIPGLPLMFESAPLILGFWHGGEALEHLLKKKITAHSKMQDLAPKKIQLVKDKRLISVKKLIPNDIIIGKGGVIIPVDVISLVPIDLFTTEIDGAPFPKLFKPGDIISAGTRIPANIDSLELRVKSTFQNSYLARQDAEMEAQAKEKAADNEKNKKKLSIEVITNTILKYFVPGLLSIALISGITIGVLLNPALAIQCAISVLVSACPCALKMVKPLADRIGMSKARKKGIEIKTTEALHAAAEVDAIVFDLNGTLTTGRPKMTDDYEIFDKQLTKDKFFQYITLLEKDANHSIAQAIFSYTSNNDFSHLPELKMSNKSILDCGVKATMDGHEFMIGNENMMAMNGIVIPPAYRYPIGTSSFLVRDNEVIGRMAVADPLRSDAVQTIRTLKALGKEIHICTGADENVAINYAKMLGIYDAKNPTKNICAQCTPSSKSKYIQSLQKTRNVMMVGDGSNDSFAFSAANVATLIQTESSTNIVKGQAGIVIKNQSLMSVVTCMDISKKTTRTIWQSLMVSLTYNTTVTLIAGGLLLGLGFALNPAIGIALMVIETAIVLMNVYRFSLSDDTTSEQQNTQDKSLISIPKMLGSHEHTPQKTIESEPMLAPQTSPEHHQAHKGWRFFATKPIRTDCDNDSCSKSCELDERSQSPSPCSQGD